MKPQVVNRTYLVLILATVLIVFGTRGTSYGQTITVSTPQPLTEATLHGSVVTLTLRGINWSIWRSDIRDALTVSGIEGVGLFNVGRVSNTKVTVKLRFNGDFDTDATLTFTVGADAIAGYSGKAATLQLPVTAVEESLTASTVSPLTEATLDGSIVTLTLSGRNYTRSIFDIADAVSVSGIDGVTFESWLDVERVSDMEVTVELTFCGDFDTDATLTLTVSEGGIAGYGGQALTTQVSVTAMQESLIEKSLDASTVSPLAETTLDGSIVTLTLNGGIYQQRIRENSVTVSGIEGITIGRTGVDRVSDTEIAVELTFDGDFDTDATLTLTVDVCTIAGYSGQALTTQVPVTAVQESLVPSTVFPLKEITLDGSVVTLTLNGRIYEQQNTVIRAVTVSDIPGVTTKWSDVNRISDTEITIALKFEGDFDTDAILTFTVGAGAIAGYNGEALTAQISITAVEQSNATVSISPSPVLVSATGEQLRLSLNIANGENIAGYQATLSFDPTALRYVESANGDYLPADAFFGDPIVKSDWIGETSSGDPIWDRNVTLAVTALDGASNGDGTLATLTFEVTDFKASTLTLSQVYLIDSDGKLWEAAIESGQVIVPPEPQDIVFGDINHDGVVNIQDLVIVHSRFGQTERNRADVNGDGLIDIADLVLVAGAFDEEAAAPPAHPQVLELLTAADVRQWLSQAQQLALTDPAYLRGITVLEQLHAALIPQETTLLPNYPNPFNPETWIPYRLSHASDVDITIYDTRGMVVRRLDLGHQMAGYYTDRTKAAYWNGRNEHGESVASGIYFYQLRARDYTALRRMVILK